MKKNISINLQGIIFHIEEDGYEVLSRYLTEVKSHFASYQGHEDIVSDIEGRIAELFSARITPLQQVISLIDVEAMIAKMGRVSDFAMEADEDYAEAEDGPTTSAFGANGPAASTIPSTTGPAEPRRLYRDMAHRKIAGVAAGIAQYFNVSPLWVRIGWVVLALFTPGLINLLTDSDHHIRLHLGSWAILAYAIMWMALPKRYDAPTPNDTPFSDGPLAGRKYYRDVDNGKIGGVAAGLAHYLRADVTLIRIILLAGLFVGGFTFVLYVILWIASPQAITVADKMRMRGDAMTLEGFDSKLRNAPFDDATLAGGNRPVGAFLEDLGRNLRPLVNFAGSFIRVAAGVLLTMMGFGLLLFVSVVAGVAAGLIPQSENIVFGDLPVHVLLNGVPEWGVLAGFLAFGIPALSLLLGGLNLLFRRTIMNRTVSLSLLGLWLLSVVGVTMAAVRQSHDFQHDAEVEVRQAYPELTKPVLFLDEHSIDRQNDQWPHVSLAAIDSGRTVEVLRTMSAKGSDEDDARRNASTTIAYNVRVSGDSSLVFDDHFSFQSNAKYRDQDLHVVVRLPRDRTFRISSGFASLVGDEGFVNNRQPNEPEKYRYRLAANRLQCVECPNQDADDEDNDADIDINVNVNGDDDNDSDDNAGRTVSGAPSFNLNLNHYGAGRRSFPENDFTKVRVQGGYRVMIRQGDNFRIEAAGQEDDLRDLRIEREGNELDIRPRRSGLLGTAFGDDHDKILISITMPDIEAVSLAGAVQADVAGFPRQVSLAVEQAGASHLRLNGDFNRLDLELAGACRTTAAGEVDQLEVDAAGACNLAGAELRANTANLDLAGVSHARLQVNKTLKAEAVGACVIEYSGNPTNVDTDATGASRVKRLK
jgi:phage shock protein PspC (stress-responsive transcriptional regulator)